MEIGMWIIWQWDKQSSSSSFCYYDNFGWLLFVIFKFKILSFFFHSFIHHRIENKEFGCLVCLVHLLVGWYVPEIFPEIKFFFLSQLEYHRRIMIVKVCTIYGHYNKTNDDVFLIKVNKCQINFPKSMCVCVCGRNIYSRSWRQYFQKVSFQFYHFISF